MRPGTVRPAVPQKAGHVQPDCTRRCTLTRHGQQVAALIVSEQSLERIKEQLALICANAIRVKDELGRNALHVASSCGRADVVRWLTSQLSVGELNVGDSESGSTALHRSLLYGHLHCTLELVKGKANFMAKDFAGLPALLSAQDDIATVMERPQTGERLFASSWGTNDNLLLGHADGKHRAIPDQVPLQLATNSGVGRGAKVQERAEINVKQVVLCKFHMVLLLTSGQVLTCGHGQGGRLGHGSEETLLIPQQVAALSKMKCIAIAAARDHTTFLTDSGSVFTCGSNNANQLGLASKKPRAQATVPCQVAALKGKHAIGVACGRFHTAVLMEDDLFVFGTNYGQLGLHLFKNEGSVVAQPQRVPVDTKKDERLVLVAASAMATACATNKGYIYVFQNFVFRRIDARKCGGIIQLVVWAIPPLSSGNTDDRSSKNGQFSQCLALSDSGMLWCCVPAHRVPLACLWKGKAPRNIVHCALTSKLAIVTDDGQAYTCQPPARAYVHNRRPSRQSDSSSVPLTTHAASGNVSVRKLLQEDMATQQSRGLNVLELERLPLVHGAHSIALNPKATNFVVLREEPLSCLTVWPEVSPSSRSTDFASLLNDACEMDIIHDVELQLSDGQTVCAHHYMLAAGSKYFKRTLSDRDHGTCHLSLKQFDSSVVDEVLTFIYTGTCSLLANGQSSQTAGAKVESTFQCTQQAANDYDVYGDDDDDDDDDGDGDGDDDDDEAENNDLRPIRSPNGVGTPTVSLDVERSKASQDTTNVRSKGRCLLAAAVELKMPALQARLERELFGEDNVYPQPVNWRDDEMCALADIRLVAEDQRSVPAHKCVLVARSEYFNSMLMAGWSETHSDLAKLTLPIPYAVLEAVVDIFYTDDAPSVEGSTDLDFLLSVLVAADQYLIDRLKEICELAMAKMIHCRNVTELMEIAALYNSEQLLDACFNFVIGNLAYVLEGRFLDDLSDELLKQLAMFYRDLIPCVAHRCFSVDAVFEPVEAQDLSPPLSPFGNDGTASGRRRRMLSSCSATTEDDVASILSHLTDESEDIGDLVAEMGGDDVCDGSSEDEVAPEEKQETGGVWVHKWKPELASVHTQPKTPTKFAEKRDTWQNSSPCHPPVVTSPSSVWQTVPNSPTQCSSLADIMRQEEVRSTTVSRSGKHPQQPPSERSHGRGFPMPASLSEASHDITWKVGKQQQTKKKKKKKIKDEDEEVESVLITPPAIKASNPWGSTSGGRVLSFRDILCEEEKGVIKSKKARSATGTVRQDEGHPGRAWQPSSKQAIPSFSSIVRAEEAAHHRSAKSRQKPLASIQLEDRAIQELLAFYGGADHPEKSVTVERCQSSGELATPIWAKQSL